MSLINSNVPPSKRSCKLKESENVPLKFVENPMLESAAKERLYESLGFDEGKIYFAYLKGVSEKVEKEFSYSKKYRMLRELYRQGVVAKCRSRDKENFSYIILPPACILQNNKDKISQYLEELYYQNFSSQWKGFLEFTVSKEDQLIVSLLNQFTEKTAEIIADRNLKAHLNGAVSHDGIIIKDSYAPRKKAGRIDNKIFFEFTKPFDDFSEESSGYIAFTESINSADLVVKVKNRIQQILHN